MTSARRFWYWMRRVLPDDKSLGIALVGGLLPYLFMQVAISLDQDNSHRLWPISAGIPLVLPAIYGSYRMSAKHPIMQPTYRRWLMQTPWTFRHPLPLGPVHLVPQDLIVLAFLTFFGLIGPGQFFLWIPVAFLAGYLLTLTSVMNATQLWRYCYGIHFALVAACFFHSDVRLVLSILVGPIASPTSA